MSASHTSGSMLRARVSLLCAKCRGVELGCSDNGIMERKWLEYGILEEVERFWRVV